MVFLLIHISTCALLIYAAIKVGIHRTGQYVIYSSIITYTIFLFAGAIIMYYIIINTTYGTIIATL